MPAEGRGRGGAAVVTKLSEVSNDTRTSPLTRSAPSLSRSAERTSSAFRSAPTRSASTVEAPRTSPNPIGVRAFHAALIRVPPRRVCCDASPSPGPASRRAGIAARPPDGWPRCSTSHAPWPRGHLRRGPDHGAGLEAVAGPWGPQALVPGHGLRHCQHPSSLEEYRRVRIRQGLRD
jgi:hypothetical protein